MSFEADQALLKFANTMVEAVAHDQGQLALMVATAAIEFVQTLVKDTNDEANLCERCRDSAAASAERVQQQILAVLDAADGNAPVPMCKESVDCADCKGKGYTRGVSPGGTRVVRVKCETCEGSGKR